MTEPKEDVEIDEALDIYADPLLVDALREAEERGRRAGLEEAAEQVCAVARAVSKGSRIRPGSVEGWGNYFAEAIRALAGGEGEG